MKSRAAILHDMGRPWSVEEFELDPPKAGEVLVEMAAAGLCHSDEHILNGDMSAPNEVMKEFGLPAMFPMIGGHEGSGVVARSRRGRDRVRAGRPRRDVVRRGLRPVQVVQLGHGIHLRHGCAGDGSRYADGRDLSPSHRRRSRPRPPVEGRRVLETHCRFARIRSSRSIRTCRWCRWRCCRAAFRPATARRRTARKVQHRRHGRRHRRRAASVPRRSRAHGSTVPRRSSRSTRWSSNRSPHFTSAPPIASRTPTKRRPCCAI